ncbi:asparagine synthetase domain-containing protein CG17486 [Culicoides brevitarsis]|uniref:asparagine synthetase domain-containing protein CG17486 n=1 Tax=Culicoides brevitarsis TaxID=469753 RepID=UPI00307B7B40
MCGIFCEFSNKNDSNSECSDCQILEKLKINLNRRGPNKIHEENIDDIKFYGTVLHHQGLEPTIQPVVTENFVLLFNGDLFMDLQLDGQSDTDYLKSLLEEVKDENSLKKIFESLRGPYSLILYHKKWKKLYFARDPMGRNSLIIGKINDKVIISSICCYDLADFCMEVPPIGLFSVNLAENGDFSVFPWYETTSHEFYQEQIDVFNTKLKQNLTVFDEKKIILPWLECLEVENFTLNDFLDFPSAENVPESIEKNCKNFLKALSKSVQERVTLTTENCKKCYNQNTICSHCRIGILFSGGLDCSILAILADKHVPKSQPIDLFNVAFEKIRKNSSQSINWDVPDRLTAKETLKELREIRPERLWNLVEVNVTREELNFELKTHLRDIISPSKNILDESLGAALWFAARGKGILDENPYESTCRVLLVGSGADELFGGYSRHRNAFKRAENPEISLENELNLDWIRLPNRNLARDDRVISDNSATPRAPYLQEDVIQFVRSLKASQRCNLKLEGGVGDKMFLRLCAQSLGLRRCCFFKKRALQFGSRIADSRQKGDAVSSFFQE